MWFENNPADQHQIANGPLQVENGVGLIATGSIADKVSAMIRQHQGEIDNTGLIDSISISLLLRGSVLAAIDRESSLAIAHLRARQPTILPRFGRLVLGQEDMSELGMHVWWSVSFQALQ